MLHDPWIIVDRVIVEQGPYFATIVARRYEGSQCIEIRRQIPIEKPRDAAPSVLTNIRRRWRDWRERRAVKRGDQILDVHERLKTLVKGK